MESSEDRIQNRTTERTGEIYNQMTMPKYASQYNNHKARRIERGRLSEIKAFYQYPFDRVDICFESV